MRYTQGNRSHLEITFKTESAAKKWSTQPITIGNREIVGHYATREKKTFFHINLSNVSLDDEEPITAELLSIFSSYGSIAAIKPKLWEGTDILSDYWSISFDTSDYADDTHITNTIPRIINIWGNKVMVSWKATPSYCTFCSKQGHRRAACKEFIEAKENTENLKKKTCESTPPTISQTSQTSQTDPAVPVTVSQETAEPASQTSMQNDIYSSSHAPKKQDEQQNSTKSMDISSEITLSGYKTPPPRESISNTNDIEMSTDPLTVPSVLPATTHPSSSTPITATSLTSTLLSAFKSSLSSP